MQELYFFFDDSGVLHKNEKSGYFVYAGYVFLNKETLEETKRKYVNLNKDIKRKLNRTDELKAFNLNNKYKRKFYNVMKKNIAIAGVIKISNVYDSILKDKKSICRFKDYILKRMIIGEIKSLINSNIIKDNIDTDIFIYIDEQLTASDGYYDLKSSILEELTNGVINYDYGKKFPNVLKSNVNIKVHYCNSETNYMIQASDILANRVWSAYRKNETILVENVKILLKY